MTEVYFEPHRINEIKCVKLVTSVNFTKNHCGDFTTVAKISILWTTTCRQAQRTLSKSKSNTTQSLYQLIFGSFICWIFTMTINSITQWKCNGKSYKNSNFKLVQLNFNFLCGFGNHAFDKIRFWQTNKIAKPTIKITLAPIKTPTAVIFTLFRNVPIVSEQYDFDRRRTGFCT